MEIVLFVLIYVISQSVTICLFNFRFLLYTCTLHMQLWSFFLEKPKKPNEFCVLYCELPPSPILSKRNTAARESSEHASLSLLVTSLCLVWTKPYIMKESFSASFVHLAFLVCVVYVACDSGEHHVAQKSILHTVRRSFINYSLGLEFLLVWRSIQLLTGKQVVDG